MENYNYYDDTGYYMSSQPGPSVDDDWPLVCEEVPDGADLSPDSDRYSDQLLPDHFSPPQAVGANGKSNSTSSSSNSPPVHVIHGAPESSSPKNPKYVRPEFCGVCGNKAIGYHYEVPACSGCKTFFRRTLLRQRRYTCKSDGNCVKDDGKKLQFLCQACRYDKCVAAGMNPFAMQADIKATKNPVVKNILSKRQLEIAKIETKGEYGVGDPKNAKLILHLTPTVECTIDRIVDKLLYLEVRSDKFRSSSYNPPYHYLRLDEALEGPSKLGIEYPEVDYAKENWPLPITNHWKYPEAPKGHAFCFKEDELDGTWKPMRHAKNWKVMDAVVLIEYLKTLEFFHLLDLHDQKVLVKGVTYACVLLFTAYYPYSRKESVMRFPDGTVLLYTQKLPKHILKHVPDTHIYMMSWGLIKLLFDSQVDPQEYVLLKALLVCNHCLYDLSARAKNILQAEREKYAKALFHYVMAHRGPKGPNVYVELMAMVNTLMRSAATDLNLHVFLNASHSLRYPIPLVDEICSAT